MNFARNERPDLLPGLEEAQILEIIDHHPAVGATDIVLWDDLWAPPLIVAGVFPGARPHALGEEWRGLWHSPVSDTVMFKSPTCTPGEPAYALPDDRIQSGRLHLG